MNGFGDLLGHNGPFDYRFSEPFRFLLTRKIVEFSCNINTSRSRAETERINLKTHFPYVYTKTINEQLDFLQLLSQASVYDIQISINDQIAAPMKILLNTESSSVAFSRL